MIIDMHCHYALCAAKPTSTPRFSFEQPPESLLPPESPPPTAFDTCLSPRALNRWSTRLLCRAAGWPSPGPALDQILRDFFERHLAQTKLVDRCVLLAFDAYHHGDGACAPVPQTQREVGSDLYTSNSLIRALCRQKPDKYLFGASVHPYRANALETLADVYNAGACLLKLMPLHQNIDINDPRCEAFFLMCRELQLPLLLHYGPEMALKTEHPAFEEVSGLLTLLDDLRRVDAMPPVIIAHMGSPATPWGPWRHYRVLVDALREQFRHAPLYADISALLTWGKGPVLLERAAKDVDLHHKLLFGSDFPVMPALGWLKWKFGREIDWTQPWPDLTLQICRAAGFSSVVFEQAAELLPVRSHQV